MSEGKLIRRLLRFERDYTQIPNDWMRGGKKLDNGQRELSLQARGLLAMLMTHKDGFAVNVSALAADGHGGVDRIRSARDELAKAGYLIVRRGRAGKPDDWELADPSGLSDPALIGYDGLLNGSENPRGQQTGRKIRPLGKSERNGSENPTPIKNTKEHLSRVNPGDPSTRAGDEKERLSAPPAEPPSQLRRCPARAHLPCTPHPRTHVCMDCGHSVVPWADPEPTTAEDDRRAVA